MMRGADSFHCHPEPPAFGGRGIWARRANAERSLRGTQSHARRASLKADGSHYGRTLILAVSCFLALLAVTLGQNMLYWPDPTWRAPEAVAAKRNPLAQKPWAAAGGKKLFLRNCAECHDKAGDGLAKKHSADLQLPVVQQQTDGALYWKITNGNTGRGMPSFSKLPDLERWQLVLFIRTLKPAS